MTTVNFTHAVTDGDSSVVDGIYYHEGTRTLTVDLNDDLYAYNNVPRSVYDDFVNASSLGRFYTTEVKPLYGPGTHVGKFYYTNFNQVESTPASVSAAPQYAVTVGMPKNLVYASGATVTEGSNDNSVTTINNYTSLAPAPARARRTHAVTFEVNGQEKTHTLDAPTVDDAVVEVQRIAEMLGLSFKIKSVTIYFE